MNKIVFLADYILPTPAGGASESALSEAIYLSRKGWDVELFTRLSSFGSWLNKNDIIDINCKLDKFSVKVSHANTLDTIEASSILILNNISLVGIAEKVKRNDTLFIFRRHIDWQKKIKMASGIGQNINELFSAHKRHTPSRTLRLYNRSLKSADYIYDVSPDILPDTKMKFVPPLSTLSFIKKNKDDFHENMSLLIGGRLNDPIKGTDRIISVIEKLQKKKCAVRLNLMGSLNKKIKKYLRELLKENFIDYGWVSGLPERLSIYEKSNILLTLPYYEPYGLMVEEALCCGLKVITINQGLAKWINDSKLINDGLFIVDESSLVENVSNKLESLILSSSKGKKVSKSADIELLKGELSIESALRKAILSA